MKHKFYIKTLAATLYNISHIFHSVSTDVDVLCIQQTMLNSDPNNILLASHQLLMRGSSHTDEVYSN